MAKIRFVGDEPRVVPLLDREVIPDELIEIPDAVFAQYEWPAAQWDVIDSSRKVFDPATKTVDEVNKHLAKADDDERARVLTAERDGQARKGILDHAEGI